MDHFASKDWVDFARSASSPQRAEMEEHLGSGCESCRAALDFWNQITLSAAREAAYEPPEGALRSVKAMGAFHLSKARRNRICIAELVMDSLQSFATAGVRSAGLEPAV